MNRSAVLTVLLLLSIGLNAALVLRPESAPRPAVAPPVVVESPAPVIAASPLPAAPLATPAFPPSPVLSAELRGLQGAMDGLQKEQRRMEADIDVYARQVEVMAAHMAQENHADTINAKLDRKLEGISAGHRGGDIVELLSRECDLEFIFSPAVSEKLKGVTVGVVDRGWTGRDYLDALKAAAGMECDFVRNAVWIRPRRPREP